jgi:glycosyltransferase involved in cell wall biosynthesis
MSKILHVTDHFSVSSGGMPAVISHLCSRGRKSFDAVELVSVDGDEAAKISKVEVTIIHPPFFAKPWCWSLKLNKLLKTLILSQNPLIHIHGVWMAPQILASKIAYQHGLPFLLSTHGMMSPGLWGSQGKVREIKKRLYWRFFAQKNFNKAKVIHAITNQERDVLSFFFPRMRIEVIPNAIDLEIIDNSSKSLANQVEPVILFLGRIHPVKGIDLFLKGYSMAGLSKKWRILIAGPDWSPSYTLAMKKLSRDLGVESTVRFLGPVYDNEKWDLIRKAWIVVVPSKSEVMSMVNLEAAACHTPTLTTHETGLSDWADSGGMLVNASVENISQGLKMACLWSESERIERGNASRALIEKKYSWDVVFPKWVDIYRSVLEN